jgi:hypothetical protein
MEFAVSFNENSKAGEGKREEVRDDPRSLPNTCGRILTPPPLPPFPVITNALKPLISES